ncbi:MAG: cytochrome c-type biogenesis protein CcmH [Nitrospirota bacterium]|nr:cytochrome c-type biogenesis protein CcmH [Nitrospirota bacterium]
MRMSIRFTLILLLILTSPWPLLAEVQDETALDIQVREIAKTLRCTVCQTENIWESGAPLAQQMRGVVRERLKLGHSPEDIQEYFLSRYGDYIMMEPPKHGVNWLIWVGPFILLLGGGLLLYKEVNGWVRGTPSPPAAAPPPLDEQARQRLERELES